MQENGLHISVITVQRITMNKHHPLCYNNYSQDEECELCWVITYVVRSITPECDCEYGISIHWDRHSVPCRYAAFMYATNGGRHE